MPVPPKLMSVRHSINKSLLSLPAAIKAGCYNYSFTIWTFLDNYGGLFLF